MSQNLSSAAIVIGALTLKAPIATKVVCFSRLLNCLRSLYGKQFRPDQTAVLCPRCLLLYFIRSVMLANILQQTTSADDIFTCIFLGALRVKIELIMGTDTYVIFELVNL